MEYGNLAGATDTGILTSAWKIFNHGQHVLPLPVPADHACLQPVLHRRFLSVPVPGSTLKQTLSCFLSSIGDSCLFTRVLFPDSEVLPTVFYLSDYLVISTKCYFAVV